MLHGFSFFSSSKYIGSMQALIKLILLALTFFFLVFINPSYIGKGLYYASFPLLFFLVWLFYRITYYVSEKEVIRATDETFHYSLFCAMVPPLGEGDLLRGRLIITKDEIILYRKDGRNPVKESYCLAIADLEGFSIGKVLSVRSGITFKAKGQSEAKFVVSRAHAKKGGSHCSSRLEHASWGCWGRRGSQWGSLFQGSLETESKSNSHWFKLYGEVIGSDDPLCLYSCLVEDAHPFSQCVGDASLDFFQSLQIHCFHWTV